MKGITIEEAKVKLIEINEFVKQLDDSMRSAALQVMLPLYFATLPEQQNKKSTTAQEEAKSDETAQQDTSDLGNFISSFEQNKPADNVMLMVAWLYSHYGQYPIEAKEIQELGDTCGLVIPSRPDMTLRQAKNEGKSLFKQEGKGWRLTVNGELYIKQKFNIKKGNKPLPKE